MANNAGTHTLRLDGRERLGITGVTSLSSFDDTEVILQTEQGRLVITGDGLNVGQLDIESGSITVSGLVISMVYEESSASGLWARLFK
jgi:sporulation protein YabP